MPFPNGHRKLLDSLKEEEKRPSETTERRAPSSQERDRSLGREKASPRSLAVARMLPRAPRRVPSGVLLHQKASLPLWGATAPARTRFPRRKTQNPWRKKGVRKRGTCRFWKVVKALVMEPRTTRLLSPSAAQCLKKGTISKEWLDVTYSSV